MSTCPTAAPRTTRHFVYKLAWLKALAGTLPADLADTVVCGDMNIAPTDADVWDIRKFGNSTHVTPEERAALAELEATGLADVIRLRWPDARTCSPTGTTAPAPSTRISGCASTWCSAGSAVQRRLTAAWVDRQARKGSGPSDHAPVMVDLDEAPDGDIGPVVPPPSAPRSVGRLSQFAVDAAAARAMSWERRPDLRQRLGFADEQVAELEHRPAGVALVEGRADRERPPA